MTLYILYKDYVLEGGNTVTVMLTQKKEGFTVLCASDSLISMQFSEHMKLPQVFEPQL